MTSQSHDGGLENKVAIVTGAASGLGATVVEQLLAAGARVAAVDRNEQALRDEFSGHADGLLLVPADVSDERQVQAYVRQTAEKFGRVDLLHNNAGVLGPRRPIPELGLDEFEDTMRINLRGAFLGLREALRRMREQGEGGAIVNTASVAALRGSPGLAAYVASKHALVGLTRTAALEAGGYGVRVNAVCPGAIDTPLLWADTTPERMTQRMPHVSALGRVAQPAEVAALVLWLLSDRSSFVTGAAYPIDGGQTA